MKMKRKFQKGTMLLELIIAASLTGIILGAIYLWWATLAKSWMTERVKSTLNEEIQVAISRMKKEVRLSSGKELFYYPSDTSTYTAFSFPIPIDDDNDNLIELDAEDNIIWDRTIIYHVSQTATGKELRRTVFNPRDNTLTSAERQEQLNDVATNGNAEGTYNAENAATKTLFDNLESFEIIPNIIVFDGYASVLQRTDYVSFGGVALTAGNHTLRFTLTGKNSASTDYHIAIDALLTSPSGGKREAEELLPPEASSGQLAENVDLSAVGSWSGNAHMLYHGNATEQYVEFEIYHDEWVETNFDHADGEKDATLTQHDLTLDPPEIVLYLDGMKETWDASTQTGGASTAYTDNPPSYPDLKDLTFRTIISKDYISTKGERIRCLFRAHPSQQNLKIVDAYIEERSSGQDGSASTRKRLQFSNAAVTIGTEQDLESGAVGNGPDEITIPAGKEVYSNWVSDFPIDPEKDYLVTYYIADEANMDYASYFPGGATTVNSYYRSGNKANKSNWGTTGTNFSHIISLVEIQVTHPATGTWTSQIYDTQIANPDYGQLSWDAVKPTNTDATVSIRASDDPELADNPAWTTYNSSPSTIPNSVTGRYVQLRANLISSGDYYETPLFQRMKLQWPGDETIVDIGGWFSQDVDNGVVKLTVDGQELTRSVQVKLKASEIYQDRTLSSFISSEIEPRNTPE